MNDFSSGFTASTNEMLLFAIVFGVVAVGLIIAGFLARGRSRSRRTTRSHGPKPLGSAARRVRLDELLLTRTDRVTLRHLAWLLKNPDDLEALVNTPQLLGKAVRKALAEGIIERQAAMQLGRRLNVPQTELATAFHGESIPSGAVVSISDRGLHVITGRLVETGKRDMRVRAGRGVRGITDRSGVEVLINTPEGVYRMQAVVEERRGRELILRRTSRVEHVQRRRYRRREASLPVRIRRSTLRRQSGRSGLTEAEYETTTHDISLGGAALKNPGRRLHTGDRVACSITAGSGSIAVEGVVLRTSRRGRVAQIVFVHLNDAIQQRLFRALRSIQAE